MVVFYPKYIERKAIKNGTHVELNVATVYHTNTIASCANRSHVECNAHTTKHTTIRTIKWNGNEIIRIRK